MHLFETANSMFLSFIRFELLSFEHGNPISHKMCNTIMWLYFFRVQSSFLSPRGTQFPSHLFSTHFVHIWKVSIVFMEKNLIVQSLYVHLKDGKAG